MPESFELKNFPGQSGDGFKGAGVWFFYEV